MSSPTNIRWAVEADLTALVAMASDMHDESPRFRHLDFSAIKTADCILGLIVNENGGALVAEKDGHIIGAMVGFVAEHFFGADRVASDLGLYIKPEHRGEGRLALCLVRAFEKWAGGRGARDCVLGVSTEVGADRTAALYARMGYRQSGFTMRRDLQNV